MEHSGTLEACQLLSLEERLGSEENGALPGIAYNVTQIIWEFTEKLAMESLGFSKRQDQKEQFMSAHAAGASTRPPIPSKPRKPARMTDTRFG